jgi:hypothetical protein
MEMRIVMRKHLTTFALVVLALAAGSEVVGAQNNERLASAIQKTPNGSEQTGSRQK